MPCPPPTSFTAWLIETDRHQRPFAASAPLLRHNPAVERQGQQQFIALAMPEPPLASAPQAKLSGSDMRIEARRGDLQVTVSWPSSAAAECALLLRELLR